MKVRLKITVCKGSRIESVPLSRLEKAAKMKRRFWSLKDGWLILDAFG